MAEIYLVTNDVNEKVYVGATKHSVRKRWREHKQCYMRDRCKNFPLYQAMKLYGEEHFKAVLLEVCEDEVRYERELYWIRQYNSYKTGYNGTLGGKGRYIWGDEDRERIIDMWNNGLLEIEIAREIGCSREIVNSVLIGNGVRSDEIAERAKRQSVQERGKPVSMYTKQGVLVATFDSILSAGKYVGATKKHSHRISMVCRGLSKSAYKHLWRFADESAPLFLEA